MKELKKKLVEIALQQVRTSTMLPSAYSSKPYMPEEVPKSYLLMEQKIREKLASGLGHYATVSWKDFLGLATECSIPEEQVLLLIIFRCRDLSSGCYSGSGVSI